MSCAALLSLTTAAAFALGGSLWRGLISPQRFVQALGGGASGLAVFWATLMLCGGGHG